MPGALPEVPARGGCDVMRGSTWNRTSAMSPGTIGAIILRDAWTCAYCGVAPERDAIQFDHIVPRSSGGPSEPGNVVLACADCNGARGDGPVPTHALEEVARRLAQPIDRKAGRALGDELYPWAAARRQAWRDNTARRNAHQRRMAEQPEDPSWPFGVDVEERAAS